MLSLFPKGLAARGKGKYNIEKPITYYKEPTYHYPFFMFEIFIVRSEWIPRFMPLNSYKADEVLFCRGLVKWLGIDATARIYILFGPVTRESKGCNQSNTNTNWTNVAYEIYSFKLLISELLATMWRCKVPR